MAKRYSTSQDVEADAASLPPELPPSKKKTTEDIEKAEIQVHWDGDDDPKNPQNWSTFFKSWVTLQLGMLAFGASLASSITAPADRTIAEYIGVSENVVVLNVSLYVIGFGEFALVSERLPLW